VTAARATPALRAGRDRYGLVPLCRGPL